MDSATDAFTIWDHDLNLVDLNRAALTYLPEGTKKEDLLGKNYTEFLPGARERGEYDRYLQVITTGIPFSGTEQIPGSRFGRRWVVIKAFRVGEGVGIVTTDITPQKDAEETLRESEATLSGIFSVAPVGIALVADRVILRVNDKICEISGYSRAELAGKDTRFLYPTEAEYDLVAKVNYHEKEKYGLSSVETRWRRKDGTLRTILLSGAPLNPDDPKKSWIIIVLDITESKQMEDEMRLLKISVDRAHDEVFWMDFSGRILYVNDAACRITGYSREELEAMKIFELDPDFPPSVWEMSVADLRKRKSQYIITRHRCKDGRIIDVEILATYVKEDGIEYSFAFVRDISDRVRMEEQLSDQHLQLDNLMQNLPLGIFRINPGPPARFVMVNLVLARMFGYDTLEEFRQIIPDSLMEDPGSAKKIIDGIRDTGSLSGYEIRLKTKNGDPFWAAFSVISVPGPDNKTAYIDGVVWDITARKKAEEALAEANRKFKLLNSMTRHDILNQLTALQGFVEVTIKKTSDEKLREYMTRIDKISRTIQRQTEFTRAYQELGINVPAWVRLDEVIGKTAAPVPVTHTDTCARIELFADPMLEQVFFNLFDNAGRHGKQVTEIKVRCEVDTQTLRIIVEDDGVGIPAIDKEKIFTKGFGSHTGLGLFLVKEILSITGITIRENGRPGAGARFEMEVPKGAFRIRN